MYDTDSASFKLYAAPFINSVNSEHQPLCSQTISNLHCSAQQQVWRNSRGIFIKNVHNNYVAAEALEQQRCCWGQLSSCSLEEKMVLSLLYYGGQIKRDTRTLSSSRRGVPRIHTTQLVRANAHRNTRTYTQSGEDRSTKQGSNQLFHILMRG